MYRILKTALFTVAFSSAAWAQQGITPCTPAATLNVTTSSSNVQLSACGGTVLLWNVGAQEAFYAYGSTSATAATTSSFSLPGTSFVVLSLGNARPYLAAITSTSSTTLRITQGQTR